jgi:hypothetical protein
MESITKEMYIMATLNNISHEKLVSFLFSSYKHRLKNLKKLGIIPEKGNTGDLKWLMLLLLQDRGYISDITRVRLSSNDNSIVLGILDLVLDSDHLKQQQAEIFHRLRKKRMSNEKMNQVLQLVEDIEEQLDKNDDFIGTFCKHIQIHKNKQTEMIWGSFVRNRAIDKMLNNGSELIRKQPRPIQRET